MSINLNTKIVTTTPYTIVTSDEVVFVNVPGPASVVLPTVVSGAGLAFYIKDISGNATVNPITISALGNLLVDGTSFALLNRGYSHIQVVYDGTGWMIIA